MTEIAETVKRGGGCYMMAKNRIMSASAGGRPFTSA
jgi:hypothetical protein